MSGHSHWAQIKRSKSKVDAQRGARFSQLAKDLTSAARHGGGNPDGNLRLKIAIQNARTGNMPMDTIQRAIDKGTGSLEGTRYEDLFYEGYGPGGVAVMMEVVTDNRNRTAADLRTIFSRCNGNLGDSGSVSWMFARRGVVSVPARPGGPGEDDILAVVLDAGAEDLKPEADTFAIDCAPEAVDAVAKALGDAGIQVTEAGVQMIPATTVEVAGEVAQKLFKLLEALEENEDVQQVYANFEISEGELAALEG